jgi:hypothetical protein
MMVPVRRSIPCTGCGSVYTADAWRALATIETLGEAELRPHVVAWPKGRDVEVRACGRCGRTIARLSPAG